MNYRPNPFAMSLRRNAPRIIGVIVPDIVTHFFSSILSGIEDTAVANGYFVIITTSHESYQHEKRSIENLVNMRVEGIIACLSQETTDSCGRSLFGSESYATFTGQWKQTGCFYWGGQSSGYSETKKAWLFGSVA